MNVERVSAAVLDALIAYFLRRQQSLVIELDLIYLGAPVIEQRQNVFSCFVLAHFHISLVLPPQDSGTGQDTQSGIPLAPSW